MSDLNQFIDPDLTTNDVLHSSGLGSGGGGGLSMDQRKRDVRVVGDNYCMNYKSSKLGSQASGSKARTATDSTQRAFDASTGETADTATYGGNNRAANTVAEPQVDKSVERRQHFIEPPGRNYDRFA